MDRYTARMTQYGTTQRERVVNRLKTNLNNKLQDDPSYKSVKLNGKETHLIINTSTKPYYKEFQSLPDQKILAGDYVEWANLMWIVLNADCDDEIYTDGNLRQCQHEIYWQKADGTIVSRFAYTENASAYNNGESGNNTITLQSNQFMVYLPYDEETADLDNGKRIHMSRSDKKCKPYDLTRPDDISYGFGEKGILNIIFTQTQYNPETDKLITLKNGTQTWICDYISDSTSTPPSDETADLFGTISGSKKLKVNIPTTYTATIYDLGGNESIWDDIANAWRIVSDFDVKAEINGNKITITVDENYVGSSFILRAVKSSNDSILTEITIDVVGLY